MLNALVLIQVANLLVVTLNCFDSVPPNTGENYRDKHQRELSKQTKSSQSSILLGPFRRRIIWAQYNFPFGSSSPLSLPLSPSSSSSSSSSSYPTLLFDNVITITNHNRNQNVNKSINALSQTTNSDVHNVSTSLLWPIDHQSVKIPPGSIQNGPSSMLIALSPPYPLKPPPPPPPSLSSSVSLLLQSPTTLTSILKQNDFETPRRSSSLSSSSPSTDLISAPVPDYSLQSPSSFSTFSSSSYDSINKNNVYADADDEYGNAIDYDKFDEEENEIYDLDRTAPDTSAGLLTKAIDNVVRFFPSMRIRDRQNPGCVGGTKCQFFVFCWMSGGSLGASCGPLHTCCVTPSSQDIQPKYWGPVINDPQCGKSATRISRIVGGSDASFGQFPWQAFVQVGGSRCGGALVGPAHVVTAGHCVARSQHNPSSIRVTLGDYILHSEIESLPHEVFTVSEVKLHPNFRFTPQADRYDVAVLVLDRSVQYRENIMPICLPPKDTLYVGRMSYVAGWGALQAGSKLRPKVLQHVPVPVIENNICETWHKQRGINIKIYDEMMCAGYETGGKDACQGDSGGPLMLNEFGVWYLIGIVSAGYSCAKQYQPGIYHRVSSSSDWVSANVFPSAHFRVPNR
ncbi:Serine proteinase stubble [Sarcoptes scabiei]|uniref:Serine proteinase stubble n=1 Tax=Sarcoptes scabiei TaxID=52283 RepID=A0A834VC56_SARSC|nr:Serine proteinase stubble [Sarcoptes scabiei]